MYIGHVGAALAGKRARRSVGLLLLLIATYTSDWVDTGLCVLGKYSDQQLLSHSLPAVGLFALIGFAMYATITKDLKGAMVVAAVVVSHMVLDWITGNKPTWPGGPTIGLRLYDHPIADFVVEAFIIAVGATLYAGTLPARPAARVDGPRRIAPGWSDATVMFGALVGLQLVVDFGHVVMKNVAKC